MTPSACPPSSATTGSGRSWSRPATPSSQSIRATPPRSAAGVILLDAEPSLGLTAFIDDAPKVDRYNEIAAAFTTLETAANVPGPKLVFAHIRIPHDPYLFARDGRFLPNQTAHNPGYPDQVWYVNSRMLPIIDRIRQQTEVPPIIVLQGDHGSPEFRADPRRMKILNAYLVPERVADRLYAWVTPVNTFRLIFDGIFGTEMGTLPDRSYLSLPGSDMDFTLVPEDRGDCPD